MALEITRNNRNVKEFPEIIVINVEHQDTTVEKQRKRAKRATRRDGADFKDKRIVPLRLSVTSNYSFKTNELVLHIYDKHFKWNLVSLTGFYEFSKTLIEDGSFIEITEHDFVYNMIPQIGDARKARTFKLDIRRIDRHVLMKEFSINLSYTFLEGKDMLLCNSKYSFQVPYFQLETHLQSKLLKHHRVDERITPLYNCKFKPHHSLSPSERDLLRELDQYQSRKVSGHTDGNTMIKMLEYALNIEDLSSQEELKNQTLKKMHPDRIKDYTLEKVRLNRIMSSYYSFPCRRSQLPPNFEEHSLSLVPMEKYKENKISFKGDCIFAKIDKFAKNRLYFEKKFPVARANPNQTQRMINLESKYFVRFIPNGVPGRTTNRACFQALDSIRERQLLDFFNDFEDTPVNCKRGNGGKFNQFEWYNQQIATNEEQMMAIKNIVNCTAYPFPYVVFGPPGTGKTSCIVECIAQILKNKPAARIMVTAQSNSACDEVGVRLLKYISRNKIFRFYSPSLLNSENSKTSALLRETSNLRHGNEDAYPTKEELYHFNVVIITLMTCSRLVQLDVTDMNRHFDYIFIDESAAATEAEAYVPIVGLGTDLQEITTNLILLGDHKQLGPVISSDIAGRLGLGESLMERIMSKRRYSMNSDLNFDPIYVTQLLDNFRSHPAILQFSNVLFYESKLRAKVSEPERSFGTQFYYLGNKKFPILFHCVKTPCQIIRGGTSSYNDGEIDMVQFYVDYLLDVGVGGGRVVADDIGIVSPYKAQLNKLRQKLRQARNVEIGTAEYYQGREKKIIIISTVKSRDHVGFLKSEKRLNVCITRAKSLLIIVGNADTLQQNSLWNSFIHFCKANDGCCGEPFTLSILTEEELKVQKKLNSIFAQESMDEESEMLATKNGEEM